MVAVSDDRVALMVSAMASVAERVFEKELLDVNVPEGALVAVGRGVRESEAESEALQLQDTVLMAVVDGICDVFCDAD